MSWAEKLDELGKPAWIVLMIVGFIIFWPLGLAVLAYILWSGRMGCWRGAHAHGRHGAWRTDRPGTWWYPNQSSGNRAFDEYRSETLKRLEEEQREFREFLDRLRFAKDKTEFDQFMADRRNRQTPPESSGEPRRPD
ncbi:MAG TPA: DUF2852 domain-containing protein [Xanthobacteraceae bacterium]|jgi:hypothetical protein